VLPDSAASRERGPLLDALGAGLRGKHFASFLGSL
jgi:hypothetical protein